MAKPKGNDGADFNLPGDVKENKEDKKNKKNSPKPPKDTKPKGNDGADNNDDDIDTESEKEVKLPKAKTYIKRNKKGEPVLPQVFFCNKNSRLMIMFEDARKHAQTIIWGSNQSTRVETPEQAEAIDRYIINERASNEVNNVFTEEEWQRLKAPDTVYFDVDGVRLHKSQVEAAVKYATEAGFEIPVVTMTDDDSVTFRGIK